MNKLQLPKTPLTLLAASLSLALTAGCDGYGQPEADPQLRAASADEDDDDQRLAGAERPDAGDDWRAWAEIRATELAAARPDLVDALDPAQARPGRDGKLRLRGPWMADADAGPLLADALAQSDAAEDRAILADALAHAEGVPASVLVDLAVNDDDARVRAAVAPALWRLGDEASLAAIETALSDPDADVRIGATTAAARHPRGRALAETLTSRLDDEAPEVRLVAARAVGAVGSAQHVAALEPLLDDADPQVRLVALRAAANLDPTAAARLAEQHGLHADADPNVARAAEKIDAAR